MSWIISHAISAVKSETPHNFWSLTMYDEDGYLVPNAINRPSISDRSKTTLGADGSLTIYIQAESPGAAKDDNWLPTPRTGAFKLYLRLYGPKQQVLEGQLGTAGGGAGQISEATLMSTKSSDLAKRAAVPHQLTLQAR